MTADVEPADAAQAASARPTNRTALVIAAVVVALLVCAVGVIVGRLSATVDPAPDSVSAEAGFARDMQVHHDQGVELAFIVRDRTEAEDVRLLAYDIATTQARQSGMLYGWLEVWGLPQASPEPAMTWMTRPALSGGGHTHGAESTGASAHEPGEPMPGYATPEQIAELKAASGVEAEVIFLELMIAHHNGAVEMAQAVLERTLNTTVRDFAESVIASQRSEIELMQSMLAERRR